MYSWSSGLFVTESVGLLHTDETTVTNKCMHLVKLTLDE